VLVDKGSVKRFGVIEAALGVVYTRTGRRFFNELSLEHQFLERIQDAADRSGLWNELRTDWMCLDCELMPWSVKAQELLTSQYAPVGAAGTQVLNSARALLAEATTRIETLEELVKRTEARLEALGKYRDAYQHYCWPVRSIEDLKLAPFHLLATEGSVHSDKQHGWHMEKLTKLCAQDEKLLLATPFKIVDVHDTISCYQATEWWQTLTTTGGEGMVVKSLDFISKGRRGYAQPAVNCRGPEYLRIIYGPEYLIPENLERLRSRGLGAKRSLASREFALGLEALERLSAKNRFAVPMNAYSACWHWKANRSTRGSDSEGIQEPSNGESADRISESRRRTSCLRGVWYRIGKCPCGQANVVYFVTRR
jgi:protein phosphatase